jgi:hypothetical protein
MRGQLRSVPHAVSRGQEYKMDILCGNYACLIFEISRMISMRCVVLDYMRSRVCVCLCVDMREDDLDLCEDFLIREFSS